MNQLASSGTGNPKGTPQGTFIYTIYLIKAQHYPPTASPKGKGRLTSFSFSRYSLTAGNATALGAYWRQAQDQVAEGLFSLAASKTETRLSLLMVSADPGEDTHNSGVHSAPAALSISPSSRNGQNKNYMEISGKTEQVPDPWDKRVSLQPGNSQTWGLRKSFL